MEDTTQPTVEAVQQTQQNKSKKKKANKKKSPLEVSEVATSLMSQFPVSLKSSAAKGRYSTAKGKLPAGTVVNEEVAVAWVVRKPYVENFCNYCGSQLDRKKAVVCGEEACGDNHCGHSHGHAFFCSKECKERDLQHSLECSAHPHLPAIAHQTNTDIDLLRLMLSLLSKKALESKWKEQPKRTTAQQNAVETPFAMVDDLVHHRDSFDKSWIRVVTEAAEALLKVVPAELQQLMTADELVTLGCRINSNSHGLGDPLSRNTDVAFGLFPLTALFFNHSCAPNCNFVGTSGGVLQVRTIREVLPDEELCVSYVDLYATRQRRRSELLATKHFWCKCKRCAQPFEKSVDRFLTAVICSKCKTGVFYQVPSNQAEELTKPIPADTVIQCSNHASQPTPCTNTITVGDLDARLSELRNLYEKAVRLMSEHQHHHHHHNHGSKDDPYTMARVLFEQLLQRAEGFLHKCNVIRMDALVPLMNCSAHDRDYAASLQLNRDIIQTMEQSGAFPEYSTEIADFYFNLFELYGECLQKTQSKEMSKRYLQQSKECLKKCVDIRTVTFGKDHPITRATIARLAETK